MKHGIKYSIMSRLIAVVFIVLISFAGIFYYIFIPNMQTNIAKFGNHEAQKNLTQIENSIDEIYRLSEYLSLNSDMRAFIERRDYESASEKVKNVTHLLQNIKNNILLKDYIHSYCIIANDGSAYWSECPYDDFFIDWFEKYALKGNSSKEYLGFTGNYAFPSRTSNFVHLNLISCIFNINNVNNRVPTAIGQVIINLDLDTLMEGIVTENSIFSQIAVFDERDNMIYFSGGERTKFLQEVKQLKTNFEKSENGYYFTDVVNNCNWKIVSFLSNQHVNKIMDIPFVIPAIIIIIVALLLIFIFIFPRLINVSKQIIKLDQAIGTVANGDLDISVSLIGERELVNISDGFNHMVVKTKQYMKDALDNLEAKQKVSFELLLTKINPHFIYNTLNSVIYLARKNRNQDVIKLTSAFICLLQDSIHLEENSLFEHIETELEVINQYIIIQKYRYMDQFLFNCTFDRELERALIPKNILQPLIENSILHGICPKGSSGLIELAVTRENNYIKIVITDNGIGMEQEKADQLLSRNNLDGSCAAHSKIRPIGIGNVAEKLHFAYGTDYRFTITSNPNLGTAVTIIMPIR
ncbi:sensor histidine kinase [Ruminiclostridium cellobioparum]|uniref:sensor histidine kinase n=1 Tax=Ruminiclostridium cellobioparum TaxID=29355 RepID=UPI0004858F4E|nr:sensor histidine kinase [Ruminiclostridium cellobioparum]